MAGTRLRVALGGVLYGRGDPSIGESEANWTPSQLSDTPRPSGANYVAYEDLGVTSLRAAIANAGGKILTLPAGVFEFADFSENTFGTTSGYGLLIHGTDASVPCRGIVGSGRDTVIRMTTGSSTKSAPSSGTNGLYLIVFNHIDNVEFGNLTLEGTEQGHPYNGARINYGVNARIHHVYFRGCWPGEYNSPPGENFGLNIFNDDNTVIEDCEFDGRNRSGVKNSATAIGINSSTNTIVRRTYVRDLYTGFGVAAWLSNGLETTDFWTTRCGTGTGGLAGCAVNHERANGRIRHYRPNWQLDGYYSTALGHSNSKFAHCTLWNSDADMTDVEIHDPIHDSFGGDGMFGVDMLSSYSNSGSTQKVVTPPKIFKNGTQLSGVEMPNWWVVPPANPATQYYISTGSLWG